MYRLPIKLSDPSIIQVCRYSKNLSRSLSSTRNPLLQKESLNKHSHQDSSQSSKGSKWVWVGAVGITGFLGASVILAKSDPSIRKWVKENAPWADDVVSLFDTDKNFTKDSDWLKPLMDIPSKLLPKSSEEKSDIKVKEDKEASRKVTKIERPKDEPSKPGVSTSKTTKLPEERKTPPPPSKDQENVIYKTLNIDDAHKAVSVAIKAFDQASKSLKKHNDQLCEIIDSAVNTLDRNTWEKAKELASNKNALYQQALDNATKARAEIAVLENNLASGIYGPEQSRNWKHKIEDLKSDIEHAENQYHTLRNSSDVTEKYWQQVEKARQNFAFELQCLFPNSDIHKKKLNIPEGGNIATELDLMLLHVLKVVTHLQKELAASTTVRTFSLNTAIEKSAEPDFIKAKVAEEVEKERRDVTLEFQKKMLAYRIELENELRRQLKLQVEAHQDHIRDALREKENQVRNSIERQLSDKLESERTSYKLQLAAMVGKLKGVDDALKARSETDKLAKQSVALWSAGEAMLIALRKGPSSPPKEPEITPIQNEISAIETAAVSSDELVKAVLAGIPAEVKQYGVYSESALRERFSKVETLCRRVALVPEEGAGLPTYLISWLQSLLLFKNIGAIPQSELEDLPTDFSKLDTNEILQRARYCVERNDIRGAVRYMSLISGAARQVSSGWTRAARDHLATRQAAEVVMAHATAAGMLYL